MYGHSLKAQSKGRKIEWQVAAMTCVPTAKTIEESKYMTSGGVLRFKSGKTGQLTFTSPIAKPLPPGKYSIGGRIKISNANESFTPQAIVICLRKKNMNTGVVETILKTEISKEFSLDNTDYQIMFSNIPKAIQFDFNKYTYWIQLSFQRKNPSSERSIGSIQLVRQVG